MALPDGHGERGLDPVSLMPAGMILNGRGVMGPTSPTGELQVSAPSGEGARLFRAVGCAKCHVPSLRAVAQEVVLYSDLLLHDMGPALDDKIVQGEAEGRGWRTALLIGLGLCRRTCMTAAPRPCARRSPPTVARRRSCAIASWLCPSATSRRCIGILRDYELAADLIYNGNSSRAAAAYYRTDIALRCVCLR